MNASEYIRNIQNRSLFLGKRNNTALQTKAEAYDTFIQTNLGEVPFLLNGQSLETFPLVPPPPSSTPLPSFTIQDAFQYSLDTLLYNIAITNIGPTKCARILYLWFQTVASGYNWVSTESKITGTIDSWNWNTKYSLTTNSDITIWMIHLFIYILPTFVSNANTSYLSQQELAARAWTETQQNSEVARVQSDGHWSTWAESWTTWYTARQSDGNVAAAAVPSDSVLPNGSQTLEVSTTTDNPNSFVEPTKWVPLKLNGTKKNYLTYGWNDVTSTCLTTSDETDIKNTSQSYYPGDASTYNDNTTRANEVAEVVSITNTLTDEQKIIAEFWAGGPNTYSPPGMMIWFWKTSLPAFQITDSTVFFSGLDLAIHLFETSRIVWGLKKQNIEARPIQEIRRMYRGQTLTKYDGTEILGEAWVPYQATNFVTPPFPDFPSGHSAFSQSFANVMNSWFGTQIPKVEVTLSNLKQISALFTVDQRNTLGYVTISKGSSEIQPQVVPSNAMILHWDTWQSMADSSGISRKYGGIHCTSAHTGSQALANALHSKLSTYWNFQH